MDAVCQHLQAALSGDPRFRRLIVNIPPGHTKSLLTSVYMPAWQWIDHPDRQFIAVSASDTLVYRDAIRHKDVCDSPWYQFLFQPKWMWSRTQDAKGFFWNSENGMRLSRTVGQRIIGHRGDVIVIDDPIDPKDAYTGSIALDDSIDYFEDTLSERTNDESSVIILIMQRLHENDLSGHLERSGGWTVLRLPSRYEPEHHCRTPIFSDPRTEDGELLNPFRFSEETLDEKERKRPKAFRRQHQQRPAPAEGAFFHRSWFNLRWTPADLPKAWDAVVVTADTSFKKSRRSDRVAIQKWGVKGGLRFLLAARAERMNLPESRFAIQRMAVESPRATHTLIEYSTNGPAIVENLRGVIPNVIPIEPGDSKQARAEVATSLASESRLLLPESIRYPWVESLFLREILSFPEGAHDDQVDAMSQFCVWCETAQLRPLIFSMGA